MCTSKKQFLVIAILFSTKSFSGEVHNFKSGETLMANDLNGNFNVVIDKTNENANSIEDVTNRVDELNSDYQSASNQLNENSQDITTLKQKVDSNSEEIELLKNKFDQSGGNEINTENTMEDGQNCNELSELLGSNYVVAKDSFYSDAGEPLVFTRPIKESESDDGFYIYRTIQDLSSWNDSFNGYKASMYGVTYSKSDSFDNISLIQIAMSILVESNQYINYTFSVNNLRAKPKDSLKLLNEVFGAVAKCTYVGK